MYNIVAVQNLLLGASTYTKEEAMHHLRNHYEARYPDEKFVVVETDLKTTCDLPEISSGSGWVGPAPSTMSKRDKMKWWVEHAGFIPQNYKMENCRVRRVELSKSRNEVSRSSEQASSQVDSGRVQDGERSGKEGES